MLRPIGKKWKVLYLTLLSITIGYIIVHPILTANVVTLFPKPNFYKICFKAATTLLLAFCIYKSEKPVYQ